MIKMDKICFELIELGLCQSCYDHIDQNCIDYNNFEIYLFEKQH